jgi:hypothetical protein
MENKRKNILLYGVIGLGAAAGIAGLYLFLKKDEFWADVVPQSIFAKDFGSKRTQVAEGSAAQLQQQKAADLLKNS